MQILDQLSTITEDSILRILDVRLAVSASDAVAANYLKDALTDWQARGITQGEAEIRILGELADALERASQRLAPDKQIEMIAQPQVRAALNALFWFTYIVSASKAKKEDGAATDLRSVWVRRPQPYAGPGPLWQVQGISVDAMLQPDYQTVLWAIRSGSDDVLGKDGEWEISPMPSSRTDEFYERTRWNSMQEAIDFATTWLAGQEEGNV